MLFGKWRLEKIVTPSGTITEAKLGYEELIDIVYEEGFGVEKTFRNDSLIARHYWGRGDEHLVDKKNFTYLMKYRYDEQRFFKIDPITRAADKMEASGYVSEMGAPEDTITYYYTQVEP